MMRLCNPDFGIGPAVQLASVHQRKHAGEVRLEREPLQIEQQLQMLIEPGRNANRPLRHRQRRVGILLFRRLDAPLHLAHGVQIFRDSRAVAGAERSLEAREILIDAVEQAALPLHPIDPLFSRASFAEQPFEHDARVVLPGQRRCRRLPGHRVHIRAAVARLALAAQHEIDFRRDQLHRGQDRFPAELRGRNLVRRRAEADVRALGLPGMDAVQPGRAGARVFPVSVAERLPLLLRETADNRQAIAVRGERRQDWRKFEICASPLRRPIVDAVVHRDAVRHIDKPHAAVCLGGRFRCHGKRRHHGVEQGQGDGRPEAAEERPPG